MCYITVCRVRVSFRDLQRLHNLSRPPAVDMIYCVECSEICMHASPGLLASSHCLRLGTFPCPVEVSFFLVEAFKYAGLPSIIIALHTELHLVCPFVVPRDTGDFVNTHSREADMHCICVNAMLWCIPCDIHPSLLVTKPYGIIACSSSSHLRCAVLRGEHSFALLLSASISVHM